MADDVRFQADGFVVGGEPLGVDLADTLVTVTDPPTDLLADAGATERWWALEVDRLPVGAAPPSDNATVALRAALRALLDAAVAGDALPAWAIEAVNDAAGAAPTSHFLRSDGAARRWHAPDPGDIALAVAAGSVIELLGGPDAERLRRCVNPNCSMVFVATDPRRRFCTQNICGNRVRVARHYRRQRGGAGA